MRKNTGGLIRSAQQRSLDTMKRASAALERMIASDREINFRTVAAEAQVSTALLYSQQELRLRIMRSRKVYTRPSFTDTEAQKREQASRQNIMTTLRLRIKTLEEKNRELTELLERAYGELAEAREQEISARRLLEKDVRSRSSSRKSAKSHR